MMPLDWVVSVFKHDAVRLGGEYLNMMSLDWMVSVFKHDVVRLGGQCINVKRTIRTLLVIII